MNEEFEKWFRAEVIAERMYPADEEGARAAWQESRKQAVEECAALCDNFEATILKPAHQYSGEDVDCYHETAQRCAEAIRAMQKD